MLLTFPPPAIDGVGGPVVLGAEVLSTGFEFPGGITSPWLEATAAV